MYILQETIDSFQRGTNFFSWCEPFLPSLSQLQALHISVSHFFQSLFFSSGCQSTVYKVLTCTTKRCSLLAVMDSNMWQQTSVTVTYHYDFSGLEQNLLIWMRKNEWMNGINRKYSLHCPSAMATPFILHINALYLIAFVNTGTSHWTGSESPTIK